jgi:hypothetical protein
LFDQILSQLPLKSKNVAKSGTIGEESGVFLGLGVFR